MYMLNIYIYIYILNFEYERLHSKILLFNVKISINDF